MNSRPVLQRPVSAVRRLLPLVPANLPPLVVRDAPHIEPLPPVEEDTPEVPQLTNSQILDYSSNDDLQSGDVAPIAALPATCG